MAEHTPKKGAKGKRWMPNDGGLVESLKQTCRFFVPKDGRWQDHLKEKQPTASSGIWRFLRSPKGEKDQPLAKSGIWQFLRSPKGEKSDS